MSSDALKNLDEVTTLLVNGAECEPYITSHNRAMLEDTDDIVEGSKLGEKVHEPVHCHHRH